jgi:hypothetical protein
MQIRINAIFARTFTAHLRHGTWGSVVYPVAPPWKRFLYDTRIFFYVLIPATAGRAAAKGDARWRIWRRNALRNVYVINIRFASRGDGWGLDASRRSFLLSIRGVHALIDVTCCHFIAINNSVRTAVWRIMCGPAMPPQGRLHGGLPKKGCRRRRSPAGVQGQRP